jgi:hypothetical protein
MHPRLKKQNQALKRRYTFKHLTARLKSCPSQNPRESDLFGNLFNRAASCVLLFEPWVHFPHRFRHDPEFFRNRLGT